MTARTSARRRTASTSALIPAAARGPETLTPAEAVLNGEAIELFAKAVGGRDQLSAVLSVAGVSPEIDRIATYLLDPKYAQVSLRRICGYTGITVAELFACYKKALIARAHIEATHIIASRLTPIVTDVMDKALSDPTVERHKLALEVGQLIEKKGITMQQNTIAAAGVLASSQSGSLEQLHQAVGDLLFSPSRRRAAAPPITVDTLDDELLGPDPDRFPLPAPTIPRADRATDDSDRHPADPADADAFHTPDLSRHPADDHTDSVDSSAPPAEIGDAPQEPAPPEA